MISHVFVEAANHVIYCPSVLFSREGGWDNVLTAWEVFEMGWSKVAIAFFLTLCGEAFRAMDILLMAESYRLGVKRSTIALPWEQPGLKTYFWEATEIGGGPKVCSLTDRCRSSCHF